MLSAKCIEWSLIISTVLFDIQQIVNILKESMNLWKIYKKMLQNQEW